MRADDVRRIEAVRRDLREVWAVDAPFVRIAHAMTKLVTRTCAAAYDLSPDGRIAAVGQTIGGSRSDSIAGMRGEDIVLPPVYGIERVGPDANRVVGLREIAARHPERVEQVREEMFIPNGIEDQLRTVFGDPHVIGWVGVFRLHRTRAFDANDVALFEAVLPDLHRALVLWRAIGRAPLPRGLLGDVLDALDQPAYLLAGGVVVFANGVGRTAPVPGWVDAVARGDGTAGPRHGATVRRLDVEGRSFTIVLARRESIARSVPLPRWLARVAELAGEGLCPASAGT